MSSLWMGEDHLVYVKGSGFLINFTEQYRRFRYEDIQYFAITKTNRAVGIVLYSLSIAFLAGIMATILAGRGEGALSVLVIVTLSLLSAGTIFFLILLLRHMFLGPTCYFDLNTAMKRERIAPLNRFYLANQAADLLDGIIREKQNHLVKGGDAADTNLSSLMGREGDRLLIGKTVFPAFAVYSFFGLCGLAALHLESITLCATALVLIVIGNLLTFRSIIGSYRKPSPEPLRRILFVLLSSVMIFGGLALVYFVQIISANPMFLEDLTAPFDAFVGIPTLGGMVYYLLFLASILFVFATAVTGMVQTLKWKNRLQQI